MTRKELDFIKNILSRIKNKDEQIDKAIAYVNKELAQYDARRGQLKEQYDYDSRGW